MVDLLQRAHTETEFVTHSLVALLEHGDRQLLAGLCRLAGFAAGADAAADPGVEFSFTGAAAAGDQPPHGRIVLPDRFAMALVGQVGSDPGLSGLGKLPADLAAPARCLLVISDTYRELPEVAALRSSPDAAGENGALLAQLSWDEVDHWLHEAANAFAADSRTRFLLEQFRRYLPKAGLQFFPGFDPAHLAGAPAALALLKALAEASSAFFAKFAALLRRDHPALRPGEGSHDVLAGVLHQDYIEPAWGRHRFLRCAMDLEGRAFQVGLWLTPGDTAGYHRHLHRELAEGGPFLSHLHQLGDTLLWLWSPTSDHQLGPAADLEAAAIAAIAADTWAGHSFGLYWELPWDASSGRLSGPAGAGPLTHRLADRAQAMLETIRELPKPT